ncbi:ataxin-2-like isoform X2 [Oscarella lobularis]|uniref:ataxin-2-like isoform X2 n=1 Tax=Oscarella lobularis TaxID=121494 RepID=UPI003313CF31
MTSVHTTSGRNRGGRASTSSRSERAEANAIAADGIYSNKAFVHAISTLVGLPVEVTVANGNVYSGILKTISPKTEFCLDAVNLKRSVGEDGKKEEDDEGEEDDVDPAHLIPVVFEPRDILHIVAGRVNPGALAKVVESFQTDTEISKCNGVIRDKEFEPWTADEADVNPVSNLEDATKFGGGWDAEDMFRTNRKKFNVKSSYNETMTEYTTPLQREDTDEFRKREERANQLAKEMEKKMVPVDDVGTEEERFSSVPRPRNRNVIKDDSEKGEEEPPPPPPRVETADVKEEPSESSHSGTVVTVQKPNRIREGPNMPPIPEDSALSSQWRKEQMLKNLKSFSENFQLKKVSDESGSGVTQSSEEDQPSTQKQESFTFNPDAKEFCPTAPTFQPSVPPSPPPPQQVMLPAPATPTSPSVSPESQMIVQQQQRTPLLSQFPQQQVYMGPQYMPVQQQNHHHQQQPFPMQQLPLAAPPQAAYGQPARNRGPILVNQPHPSAWQPQMIPVQQMIPQHSVPMVAQPMMAPSSPQMGPSVAWIGGPPAEMFVPAGHQAAVMASPPPPHYGHPQQMSRVMVAHHHHSQQQQQHQHQQQQHQQQQQQLAYSSQYHQATQLAAIHGAPLQHAGAPVLTSQPQGNNDGGGGGGGSGGSVSYARHGHGPQSPVVVVQPTMFPGRNGSYQVGQ